LGKHFEFTAYINTIIAADTFHNCMEAHGDTRTVAEAADGLIVLDKYTIAHEAVDKLLRRPRTQNEYAPSDGKTSNSNTNKDTTEFCNIGDDAQAQAPSNSFKPAIEQLLTIFKATNDTIKHSEFTHF